VWLIILGPFALTAAGLVVGSSLILFLLVALTTPVLVLRHPARSVKRAPQPDPVRAIAGSRRRFRARFDAFDQSPSEVVASDVYNEGGAQRRHVSSGR
jgi:hypothetical protein